MPGLLSFLGGNQAQVPGSARPNPMQGLLDPQVALPMAAALMGNQGNTANFGNAFAAAAPAFQQRKELEAQTAQKNQTIEFLRQNAPEYAQAVEAGMPVGDAWKAYTQQREVQKPTDTMRNLEWRASQAGLQPGTPEYADFIRTGGRNDGVTVNVGDGSPGLGKLSTDYGWVLDPETGQPRIDPQTGLPQAAPVPGSPAAQEAAQAASSKEGKDEQRRTWNIIVNEEIGRALNLVDKWFASGVGSGVASQFEGTSARNLQGLLSTIKANAGFDRLQAMRDASPTGGALGQVSERELAFLQSTIGNLEQAQSDDQLKYNLKRLQKIYQNMLDGKRAYDGLVSESGEGSSGEGWRDMGNGVRLRRLD